MATTRDHPDADLLADLAAEVLPDDLARRVEAHVQDCDRCAGLLAEAEGIRGLLRRQETPAMPEDVADRIGAAIAGLRLGPAAGEREGLEEDPDADARWAAAASRGAVGPAGRRRSGPEDVLGAGSRFTVRRKVERGREASATRLVRAGGGGSEAARLRRQALEEQRSAERAGRVGKLVLGTAAAIILVSGAGLGLRALGGSELMTASSDAGDSSAGGPASAEGGAAAPQDSGDSNDSAEESTLAAGGGGPTILNSGGDYADVTLQAQVKVLVAAAIVQQQRAAADKDAGGTGSPAPAPQASPNTATSAGARPASGNQSLRDPKNLNACLGALGVADQPVVGVDLARYQGRDSAVIVLRADGGAYDVWIVARDCRPGADGTLKYLSMTP
jgi:hypothetical protein